MKDKTIINKFKVRIGLLSMILIFIMQSCTIIEPCGDFVFTGTVFDTSSSNGVDMDVSFDFDPATCSSTCTCDLVCYVQIVRSVDLEDYVYLYPSSEKSDRTTEYGWYLDRVAGRIWGYYGRNDSGTFASYLTTGSETTNAILNDSPRRPEAEPWLPIWWQAVSVPTCIESGSGCENNFLGYYFWGWAVDDSGDVYDSPIHGVAWENLDQSVYDAVDEWNDQAPGLGKNVFPTFSDL